MVNGYLESGILLGIWNLELESGISSGIWWDSESRTGFLGRVGPLAPSITYLCMYFISGRSSTVKIYYYSYHYISLILTILGYDTYSRSYVSRRHYSIKDFRSDFSPESRAIVVSRGQTAYRLQYIQLIARAFEQA